MTRANTLLLSLLVLLLAYTPLTGSCENEPPLTLGSNLAEISDYSPQMPFVNLFLSSREWLTQCRAGIDPSCALEDAFDTREASLLDLDNAGWVRSLPAPQHPALFTQVATLWDMPPEFPRGVYVVRYDGSGTIEYDLGARKLSDPPHQSGRDLVDMDPARGPLLLRITRTDPLGTGDYIRNIRVFAAANESIVETQRFSPEFLRSLNPYQVLRFMDWMRTNNSQVSEWRTRALPRDARYSTAQGVPIEVMLELASTTQKSPWFTIPHLATDEYIRQFALVTKEQLDGELKVFVEYSNETWNSVFEQGAEIERRGQEEWPASTERPFTKRINYYGKRSAETCKIWKEVFAATPQRVVCVLASQAANAWTADEALRCPLWSDAPCVSHGISALAIAPYFGYYLGQSQAAQEVSAWTGSLSTRMARLFSELDGGGEISDGPSGGALAESLSWIADNKAVAGAHGIDLVTYEGGQHLVGVGRAQDDSGLTELFTAANRDSRMRTIYDRYLSGWSAQGGGLFVHFTDIGSYTKYGSWGALEQIGQRNSPKYDALTAFSSVPPIHDPSNDKPLVTLSVGKRAGGSVRSVPRGLNCGDTCLMPVAQGQRVTLIARARRGYRFLRWTGACRSRGVRCELVMTRALQTSALFRPNPTRTAAFPGHDMRDPD